VVLELSYIGDIQEEGMRVVPYDIHLGKGSLGNLALCH